jgi:hypothetical protein
MFDGLTFREGYGADDLSRGDMIDINYRKYLFRDEEVHTVKELVLYEE